MPSNYGAPTGAPEGLSGYGTNTSRIVSLSDGIFGFAMTLLVVNLVLPTAAMGAGQTTLVKDLGNLQLQLLDYGLAFVVVASWWSVHNKLFACIQRYDPDLIRLNNLFLLCISITPFMMALVFTYGPQHLDSTGQSAKLAVAVFGLLEVVTGVLVWGIWRYSTSGNRLIDTQLEQRWIDAAENENLRRIGIFGLSVLVSLVLPEVGIWIWAGVLLGGRRRRRKAAEGSAPKAPSAAVN